MTVNSLRDSDSDLDLDAMFDAFDAQRKAASDRAREEVKADRRNTLNAPQGCCARVRGLCASLFARCIACRGQEKPMAS